jgi:tetratricopeptide (TPR) repeat protein
MATGTQLDTLEAKGLIRLAAVSPELEYLFRHWLVQDAAYGSLLKQERRELHRLVGEALEALYPERRAELAGILAMHFELAGDRDKAIEYLVSEGHYALERNALREAASAFERAALLLPPADDDDEEPTRRRRIEIESGRARASWTFRPVEDVVGDLEAILPAADELGDLELLAQIHVHIALLILLSGQSATDPTVQRSLNRLADLGEALDDPSLGALPLALVGLNKIFIGPIREGVTAVESAIPLMERRRDFIGAAFAQGALGMGYAYLGEFEKAEETVRRAYERAAAGGDLIAQLDAQIDEAIVRSVRGQLDQALPMAQACVASSEQHGATACAVVSAWVLGDIYQRQGRFREAREALQLGMKLSPVTGMSSIWRPTLLAWLGLNSAWLGEGGGTDLDFDEALDTARRIGNRLGEANIRWKRAEALSQQGRWEEALSDFAASAAVWEDEQARPILARVLRGWGETLRTAGRVQEADEKLRRARALFEELGLEPEAEAMRELLAGDGRT